MGLTYRLFSSFSSASCPGDEGSPLDGWPSAVPVWDITYLRLVKP